MNEDTHLCAICGTNLTGVHEVTWTEMVAVEEFVFLEDDGYSRVVDRPFRFTTLVGQCPKCKQERTRDEYSGEFF